MEEATQEGMYPHLLLPPMWFRGSDPLLLQSRHLLVTTMGLASAAYSSGLDTAKDFQEDGCSGS